MAYSLTMSAPCAKYSFPVSAAVAAFSLSISAYSEPTLTASAAFSLRTSVASRTFSWKEISYIIKNQFESMVPTLTISAPKTLNINI